MRCVRCTTTRLLRQTVLADGEVMAPLYLGANVEVLAPRELRTLMSKALSHRNFHHDEPSGLKGVQ